MPAETLNPAAGGLVEVIRTAADLIDLVSSMPIDPRDGRDVGAALEVLDVLSQRALHREAVEKIRRGEY